MTTDMPAKVDLSDQEVIARSKSLAVHGEIGTNEKSIMLEPVGATADWRFHLAALARVSDNLISRAINAYDRLFGLAEDEAGEIHFELGKRLADEDRLDEAISALRNALRARPNHVDALFELGKIQLRRGASRAAVEAFERAKASGFRGKKLRLLLAEALVREEKPQDALKETEAVLAAEPEVADVHYRHALVLDRLERHAEAVAALENAIRLAPREVRYHQSLGFSLESLGRRTDAIRSFKRALEFERSRELGRVVALE